MLGGLAIVLWTVSVVNLVLPLAGIWAWVCLAPLACSLARPSWRAGLAHDLATAARQPEAVAVATAMAGFLGALLWPLLSRPGVLLYDGTSGHDAFFWVIGAEHLMQQTYLRAPVVEATAPLYASTLGSVGWTPEWGRMGAEGFLALTASLVGASPLKIYLVATAALFFPWLAAVFLICRTFLVERFTRVAAVALVLLQPTFVFFHGNSNLPNLIGLLMGALVVVATAQVAAAAEPRGPSRALLALGAHGVLCAYPEILPAIVLPCVLLGLVAWWRRRTFPFWIPGAVAAGLLLNPATAIRAWHGFTFALATTRTPDHWPNIFAKVEPWARFPAAATLSVPFGHELGTVGGILVGLLILVVAAVAVGRAKDRGGAAAMLSGAALMLVYTVVTGMGYGWQKTVQFSAVFLIAAVPIAAIAGLLEPAAGGRRWQRRGLLVGAVAVFGVATVANLLEVRKWSGRKYLTQDWIELREVAHRTLPNQPVLIDAATFSQPFFYTMWAAYFLTDCRVYFSATDPASGGYLRSAELPPPSRPPQPRAILVGGKEPGGDRGAPLWRSATVALIASDASRSVAPPPAIGK